VTEVVDAGILEPRASADAAAVTVAADALRHFTRDVFVRAGMPEPDAALVADVLVWADLRGVDSHGVSRIAMYLRLIDDGDLNLTPDVKIRTETAASILVERESQKAIVIGKQGSMLKQIGTKARENLERLLGCKVFLALNVKVEERWSERDAALKRLGIWGER